MSILTDVSPKLPMRNKNVTRDFYVNVLGFREFGNGDFDEYLMISKDNVQIHFFLFEALDRKENYGQLYIRTDDIDKLYQWMIVKNVAIHPAGHLAVKSWGQKEFSLLDPDHNLLTFGQTVK